MWANQSTWWQIYPLGFVDAPIWQPDPAPGTPRLRRLLNWMDYASDLGVSGLLFGPIFHATTHGYDTVNHFRIDPRLGTDEDFADLVTAASQRGLKIVLDGVFNHVGAQHPVLTDILATGPQHPQAEMFDIDWSDPQHPTPRVFEGHPNLVEFNHSSEAAKLYLHDVMTYWLERGADGWRLDAAYSVPWELWAQVLPGVRETYPDAWFLGEVIHGDYPNIVHLSRMDTVTQYRLWKAIWSSLKDENFYELDWTLREHSTDFLQYFVPQTFIGNHDVTRIATQVGQAKAPLAAVAMFTVGGIPSVYYGDERGFLAEKEERHGGDDAIRPAYPVDPQDFVDPQGWDFYHIYQQLIGLRKTYPWLATSRQITQHLDNRRYSYTTHAADDSAHLHVELGLEDTPCATVTDGDQVVFEYRAPVEDPHQ